MVSVAVIVPVVLKAAAMLIPLPPVVPLLPPTQFEKTTLPLPVKTPPILIPWLAVPDPPVQPVTLTDPSVINAPNVTVPVVPGVQADVIDTPSEPEPLAKLVPLMLIAPVVLVIFVVASRVPMPVPDGPDGTTPPRLIVPESVRIAPPETLTPLELPLFEADAVPIKRIAPELVLLIVPPVKLTPCEADAPVAPVEAVI